MVSQCERCGKRHPANSLHKGDCSVCRIRPVIKKRGAIFCQECWNTVLAQMGQPDPDGVARVFARGNQEASRDNG